MSSTYTLNNGIELIGTGEQSGTWGATTNTNFELLDTALDGQVTITASSAGSSGSPNSLPVSDGAASNGRNRLVNITSGTDLGATVYYQLTPSDAEKIIYIRNSLNTQSLIVFQGTYNASNDYEIPNGKTAIIFFNGAGSGAVAANVMSNAHFDNLNIVGDVTIGDDLTLNSDGAIINIGADADLQVTHSGSAGTITNATGDLTLDVAGDIILDGDGASIRFKDNAVEYAHHYVNSNSYYIRSVISDADMIFQGNDGGSTFTALTLDMSAAGAATFNAGVTLSGDLTVDTDTLYVDSANDRVGINGSSPEVALQVYSSDINNSFFEGSNATGTQVFIRNSTVASDVYTQLGFAPANNILGGSIVVTSDEDFSVADNRTAHMELKTRHNGTIRSRLYLDENNTIFNEDNRDTDFRVESDANTHALFLDAANNVVGIGDSSSLAAGVRLHVNKNDLTTYGTDGTVIQNDVPVKIQNLDTTTNLVMSGIHIRSGTWDGGIVGVPTGNGANNNGYLALVSEAEEAARFYNDGAQGGTVFNDNSFDRDFRVESDTNDYMFFVDAGANFVGVGGNRNTTSARLNVNANETAVYDPNTVDTGGGLSIYKHTSTQTNNDSVGVAFRITTDNASTNALGAIRYVQPAYNTFAGQMVFQTRKSNGTYYEQLRLDSEAGALFNSQGDNFFDFTINSDSYTPFFKLDAGANKLRVGSYQNDDGNTMTVGLSGSQTYVTSAAEGQLAISTVNNVNGNNQHAGLFFRVSSNNGSNNANASIGLKQPSYTSHNGQIYFNLRSQSQNNFRQYALIDSENGFIVNDGGESYIDFRVASDSNTSAIFVDAALNRVGIFASGGENNFNVNAQGTSSHSSGTMPPGMTMYSNGSGDGTGNAIMFKNSTGAQGLSGIGSFRTGANGGYGRDLRFYTNDVVATDAYKEKMRIAENGAIYGPQANYGGFITAEITQSHLGNDATGTADITFTVNLKNTTGTYDNWQLMMYLTTSGNSSPAKASVYEIRGAQRLSLGSVNRTTLVSGESRTITSSVSGLAVTFTIASEGSSTATQGAKFCWLGGTYGCESVSVGDSA